MSSAPSCWRSGSKATRHPPRHRGFERPAQNNDSEIVVFEPRQGSSFARNRAVREADGEMLFFIDDDVIVEPDWAEQLLAEIGRRGLDAACGLVLAQWQAPPPQWLRAEVYGKLAVHRGESIADAAPPPEKLSQFFSANVGFRKQCFERFGLFRKLDRLTLPTRGKLPAPP